MLHMSSGLSSAGVPEIRSEGVGGTRGSGCVQWPGGSIFGVERLVIELVRSQIVIKLKQVHVVLGPGDI